MRFRAALTVLCIVLLSACSLSPKGQRAAKTGAVTGLAGAGTGAIVGAVIANGDIQASAMLGGAIGVPAGVILSLYLHDRQERITLENNNQIIINNRNEILARAQALELLREDIDIDTQVLSKGTTYGTRLYVGPTIGTYR